MYSIQSSWEIYVQQSDIISEWKWCIIQILIWFPYITFHLHCAVLMDKLIKYLENVNYVVGVFLDFSKAFDTVDHKILLAKFYHHGIRGSALDWFSMYLTNRKQFVTYDNERSELMNINCGVPQGSILETFLFSITYIYIYLCVCVCVCV